MILTGRRKFQPLKNAARLKTIVSVLGAHGFHNLAERVKLGRFVLQKFTKSDVKELSDPERLRLAFEELGPTFVKFGQLLATRPDLIPQEYVEEFKKLHDQVAPVPFSQVEGVLNHRLGKDWREIFSDFDVQPVAAASIAQAHEATLKDGQNVIVKIQRPGLQKVISEDLAVIYALAELLEHYVPESRPYNPVGVVDEFFKSLELETNFVVEANNIRRFAANFKGEPKIKIPHVYEKYTGKHVLVMERLEGIPLSHKNALDQEGIDPQEVLKTGLRCYLKMVFSDGLFHGDLHAGNMFVMPDNRIGLIDFGVVGRLNRKTQASIANMLLALADEDYDRLAFEYLDIAPYQGHVDIDRFARQLRDLIAPYYGLTLKQVNAGKLLLDSTSLAARNGLSLPSELVMFFKSIVVIESMGRLISEDFDFLSYSLEFASSLVKSRYHPSKVVQSYSAVFRDTNSLLMSLPQQLKQFIRRLNSPDFGIRVNIDQITEHRRSMENSANLLFLGLLIGSLILSASLVYIEGRGPEIFHMPLLSAIGYGLAAILSIAAFINYIRKP